MLHIDLPTRGQIDQLARFRGSPAISIFLRTTPVTQEAQGDRIELKNLIKTAVDQMQAANVDKRVVAEIETHVAEVIADNDFWAHQSNSLALFVRADKIVTFRLPNKLTNLVEVSDRYHLSPLIRAITFPHEAFVLALSVGSARLIEITADLPAQTVRTPDLPKDYSQALQKRSHLPKGTMGTTDVMSDSALLTRYARAVDRGLRETLAGQEAPLIVAATEPLSSIYRKISTYPHIAAETISGSADGTPDRVLGDDARKILDKIYADEVEAFKAHYAQRDGQHRAISDVAKAAKAATFAAVDTLMIDMDATLSGYVDEETGAVSLEDKPDAKNYSVLDEIARRTLAAGGRVLAARQADLPGGGQIAAILRYPM